jgi:hypothetical protein
MQTIFGIALNLLRAFAGVDSRNDEEPNCETSSEVESN